MKARLLIKDGNYSLILCSGEVFRLEDGEAREFILNFDSKKYTAVKNTWDFSFTMEEYGGDTVAIIDDDCRLVVLDAKALRNIFSVNEEDLLTIPEYAALHGRQPAIVRRMCSEKRIEGAIQKGTKWLIPKSSPYPRNKRSNKEIQGKRNENI